jgi:hypothetical protein
MYTVHIAVQAYVLTAGRISIRRERAKGKTLDMNIIYLHESWVGFAWLKQIYLYKKINKIK